MTDPDRTDSDSPTRKPSWRKGYARQQCVYGRNQNKLIDWLLSWKLHPRTKHHVDHNQLRSYGQFIYSRWPTDAILDFIELEIAPFDPPTPITHMGWSGSCTVCEIFTFKLYRDLETKVRGKWYNWRSSKATLFDRAHTNLYSSSTVNMPLSITVSKI